MKCVQGLFTGLLLFFAMFNFCSAQSTTQGLPSLGTPYHTVYTHLHFLQSMSYDPGKAALVIPSDDSLKARKMAIQIKQVLDGRGLFVRLNQISRDSNYVDSLTGKNTYTLFPKVLPEVYLEKKNGQWYYSNETVATIDILHESIYPFGVDLLMNLVPKFGQNRFLGIAIWQWIGLLFILGMAIFLHQILIRIIRPIVKRIGHMGRKYELNDTGLIWKISRVLSLILLFYLIKIFVPTLQLPIRVTEFMVLAIRIITTVFYVVLGLRILDVLVGFAKKFTETTESKLDEQLVPILKRTLQSIVIILGVIHLLSVLEVNVTALIAGVSIGGLALALAAQDTVKNLIGSTMIFFDQPFQIGDYIIGGSHEGTVEEVGFRTTRLRNVDQSITSIPNGTIANMAIKNLGLRVYRMFQTELGIVYGTPVDKIQAFTKALKSLVTNHPKIMQEVHYVHLVKLDASSMNIMFRVYLSVPDYAEELATKEEIYLSILNIAEGLKISFAFPSTSIYVETIPKR